MKMEPRERGASGEHRVYLFAIEPAILEQKYPDLVANLEGKRRLCDWGCDA